jgi:hypothetical protein
MADARDHYEAYFSEKFWELLPAIYREQDGLADNPGRLRAFIEVLAQHAAILRRSTDRLWDDQFIDFCDDWVVPYVGDLVATRLVSAQNTRGRRVDVAKTIYYRRRKGTLRVLEELISDITGWEGKVVEEFKRLARMRHGLDPAPSTFAGMFTGTMPGGLADLRQPRGAELAHAPFEEFYHTADVRRPRGHDGRYGIPKLAFHLYRLPAYDVHGVNPRQWANPAPNRLAFNVDPSGRDIPLFMPRKRPPDWDEWTSAREWELPAPMRCRVLNHAEYVIGEGEVNLVRTSPALPPAVAQAAADELARFIGVRFQSETALRDTVATLVTGAALLNVAVFRPLLVSALIPDCGKAILLPDPTGAQPGAIRVELTPGNIVPRERTTAGNLANWSGTPIDKELIIDPERGRLLIIDPPAGAAVKVDYFYGFSGSVGAGGYDRAGSLVPPTVAPISGGGAIAAAAIALNGVTQINDSATYNALPALNPVQNVTIQAADRQRPYLQLTAAQANWEFIAPANQDATLTLEGLWVGGEANLAAAAVVLRGDYERVVIRHTTIDPGGIDAQSDPLPSVHLVVEGNVEELMIENSIVGPIRTQGGGLVEKLRMRHSIVQSITAGTPALALPASDVELGWPQQGKAPRTPGRQPTGVTIFGAVDVNRLFASEALITGVVDVTDTQAGCFRFSAALIGSRVPHPYESHFISDTAHFFTSRRFGDPGYAQLSETAPVGLLRGAEHGSEIGVFSHLFNPIKLDSLRVKVVEYMPFGLIPLFIYET